TPILVATDPKLRDGDILEVETNRHFFTPKYTVSLNRYSMMCSPDSREIRVVNGTAELFVAGHYAKRVCPTIHFLQFHGPFDWRWGEVRLAKTIAVEQSGSVDLRLKPVIADGGKTVDLTISAREIKADGLLGTVLQLPVIGPQILDSAIKNLILNQINGHIGSSPEEVNSP